MVKKGFVIAMIFASLQFLAVQLNMHLRRVYSLQEDLVAVSRLVESDGTVPERAMNRLVLFLVNVERDSMMQTSQNPEVENFRNVVRAKKIHVNLHIMLAANFKAGNYEESLKYLSKAIAFFQDHSVFDHQGFPDLAEGIEKLVLDMENLPLQDLNSLWGAMGVKYVPSVLYRVRTVALGSGYSYMRPYVVRLSEDTDVGVF